MPTMKEDGDRSHPSHYLGQEHAASGGHTLHWITGQQAAGRGSDEPPPPFLLIPLPAPHTPGCQRPQKHMNNLQQHPWPSQGPYISLTSWCLPKRTCPEPHQCGTQVIWGLSSPILQPHVHDTPNGRFLAREVIVVLVIWGWFLLFFIPGRAIKPCHSGRAQYR